MDDSKKNSESMSTAPDPSSALTTHRAPLATYSSLLARVPLAWRNLIHDKRRFLVSTAGITLAVILMFMELGFWNGLLDSSVSLVRQFNGEIIIVSKARYTMVVREPFTIRRLAQARAVTGVRDAFPIFIEDRISLWKDPEHKDPDEASSRPIRVVAFNPSNLGLKIPEVKANLDRLRIPNTVLMDRRSKNDYGKREVNLIRELAGHSIEVVGLFSLGTDFSTDGNLITSDQTFAKLFPNRADPGSTLNLADLGVVQLEPGSDVESVRTALEKVLPSDVQVYTLPEFADKEIAFWQQATPIGFMFGCGLVMGVIVGMVICSQILSADVTDHLREYATLKAIGYSNRYIVGVVLRQGLVLSLLAFGPALLASYLLYEYLSVITGLPLYFTPSRIAVVLVLATGMCMAAGVLALRKVIKADPAEVFS
jgi:putative ABC transport system permease protein